MKIIIMEHQYKFLFESPDNSDVIKQILDLEGIEFDGCKKGQTIRENGILLYCVYFLFTYLNNNRQTYNIIWYAVDNNVASLESFGEFNAIADGFKYIPPKVLNSYFIKIGKEFLENYLKNK